MDITKARPRALSKHRHLTEGQRQGLWGFVFALPALLLFVVFSLIPIVRTFYLSFFRYDMLTKPQFIGWKNYQVLASDPTFQGSLLTTFGYVLGTYAPTLILALLLALALNTRIRGRGVFRTIFFVPVVMSMVVVAVIWRLIFQHFGLLNIAVLSPFHIGPIDWLTNERAAPWAIIMMSIWKELGFYTVIFLAGLQNIPHEYYEAAKVDGAESFTSFRFITLPLLQPAILFAFVIAIINGLQIFIPQYVMTNGGPINSTLVIALNIYQTAFVYLQMGKAAAMSVILFVIIAIISAIQFRFYRASH